MTRSTDAAVAMPILPAFADVASAADDAATPLRSRLRAFCAADAYRRAAAAVYMPAYC